MADARPAEDPPRPSEGPGSGGRAPAPWSPPAPEEITTARMVLEPLTPDHAGPMLPVLADPALYAFTGGEPPTADGLRRRYELQSAGRSPGGEESWFNWILCPRDGSGPAGFVQATVVLGAPGPAADLAWAVGVPHQGRGLAAEAALGMCDWLSARGVRRFGAWVHPRHGASAGVARRLGMAPAPRRDADGEVRWESGG
ncbi:GNAT family N-acetyltransferase [Nocardiopsis tropica]|uniref:GNAT family N-acetyltransferase n=1 Tax=Nocardiopsis tropica TaxID=109330 RepID=A0ABV2A103_9ACTN